MPSARPLYAEPPLRQLHVRRSKRDRILQIDPPAFGAALGLLEALLLTYGVGAAFALGYLPTALGLENMEM